jgi:hypothetical protein
MTKSSLSIVEALKKILLGFPEIVNSLQGKDADFLAKLDSWMKDAETTLKNNNISECSEIAGLRSKIIAPLFSGSPRQVAKKKQLQIAADVLYQLQNTILLVIKPFEAKIEEAKNLLLHLLSILKQSGAIKYTNQTDFQNFVNQIWDIFSNHEQLKASTVQILALVSKTDAIRIIAVEINLEEWR